MSFFRQCPCGQKCWPGVLVRQCGPWILTDTVQVRAQQDVLTTAWRAMLPVSPRFSLLSEWNGRENPRSHPTPGGEDHAQVPSGIQLRAAGVRWDAGVTAGLTHLESPAGVVFWAYKKNSAYGNEGDNRLKYPCHFKQRTFQVTLMTTEPEVEQVSPSETEKSNTVKRRRRKFAAGPATYSSRSARRS